MSKIPFLDPAWLKAGLVDTSGDAGSSGQILSSTGSGVNWINQADITIGEAEIAKTLQVTVKNVSGGELTKGTVVHVSPSASPPSGNVIEVIAADYDDATKMPAVGILKETIADEAEGEAVMSGALSGIATDGFTAGDELYVGADGALTNAKPQTAGQLIQKIAVCVKSHASNGLIKIFGAGRSNDVPLPLYIDNANQRVGIGEPSPSRTLSVNGPVGVDGNLYISSALPQIHMLDTDGTAYSRIRSSNGGLLFEADENNVSNDTNIRFEIDSSEKVRIDSSGKVGIGVTSPSDKLHIEDSSGANIRLVRSAFKDGNAEQFGNQISFHVGGTTSEKNFANAKIISYDRYDGTGSFRGALAFETGNGGSHERMRVNEHGNVGIGTDSPSKKLDVRGEVALDIMPGFQQAGAIRIGRSDGTSRYHEIVAYNDSIVANNYLRFDVHDGTVSSNREVLTLKGDGNVQLNSYGSGGITGTTAYNLAVDSSGNIIENSANTRSVFVATSTDTTTNINAPISEPETIQWNSEEIKDSGYTHSDATNPEQITITQAGTYKIYAAITYTTTVERANVALQILVNDVATGARGAGGYVRSQSSHNDGTTIVEDYVTLSANDVIKIQTSQEAAAGTVNLKSGESKIIIEKLTGLTLSTTDANTLGGLGATDFVQVSGDTMDGALTINEGGATIKKTGASQTTVLTIEQLADVGSSQDLLIKTAFDRDVGIKFQTAGGTNYIWQDSNGDDALILSTGGNDRTNDAALILHQNQEVIIPNGNVGIQTTNQQPFSSLFEGTLVVQGSTNEDPIIAVTDVNTANAAAGVFHQSSTSPAFPALVINAASNGSEQKLISARTNVSNTTGTGGTEVFGVDGDGDAIFAGNVDVNGGEVKISGNFAKLFFEDTAGTDEDAYMVNNANGLFFGKTNTPSPSNDILSLDLSNKNATFSGNISAANLGTAASSAATDFVAVTGDTMTGQLEIALASNQLKLSTGTAGDGYLNIGHFSNGTFIGTYGDDGGVADIIRFGTHSGDERMRITSGGDVALYETLQFFDDSSTPSASAFIHRPTSNTLALGVNSSNRIQINTDSILFNTDSKTGIDTSTTANNGHFILNGMGYVLDPDTTGTTGRLAYTISPSSYQPSIKSGTDKNVTSGGANADGSFPNTAADSDGFASETEFTFADAIAGLQGDGARLPRLEEVTAQYGRGTGDNTDSEYIWTQTFGPKGRVYQVKGNFHSYSEFRLVDPNDTNNTARVRRFFDISKANLPVYYDNDAKINVKEIRAEHSDGLKLTDESGNLGVFVEDGGDVGIGTDSPQAKLDITGATNSSKSLGLRSGNNNDDTEAAQIVFSWNGNPWNNAGYSHSIRTTHDSANESGNGIHFYLWDQSNDTSGTLGSKNVMSIIGDGNVGIGTTNPSEKLTIDGYARASHGNYLGYKNADAHNYIDGNSTHNWIKVGNIDSNNGSTKLSLEINTFGDNNYPRNTRFTVVANKYYTGVSLSCFKNYGSSYSDILYVKLDSNLDLWVKRTISWAHNLLVKPIVIDGGAVFNDDYTGNNSTVTEPSGGTPIIQNDRAIRVTTADLSTVTHEYSNKYFRIDGDPKLTILNTGNVGIGTTSPADKLDVRNGTLTVRDDSNVNYVEIDRFTGITMKGNGTASRGIQTPNTDDLTFGTNAIERVRIDSNGNVGIGTTSPNARLESEYQNDSTSAVSTAIAVKSVIDNNNSVITTGKLFEGSYEISSGAGEASTAYPPNTTTIVIDTLTGDMPSVGMLVSADDIPSGTTITNVSGSGSTRTITLSAGTGVLGSGDAISYSSAVTNKWGLYIDGEAKNYISGNVGIGTTSPNEVLHVSRASSGSGLLLENTVGGSGSYVTLDFNTYNVDQANFANYGASIRVIDDGAYSGDITFRTKGNAINAAQSEKMRIDGASGNVGIGTTDPIRPLHVIGQFAIDNSTSPTGGLLVSPDGTSNKVYSRTGNATSSAHPLDFISGSSTSMRIATNGNVGIGTTSPDNLLEVETTDGATGSEGIFVKDVFAGTSRTVSSPDPFISIGTADFSGATSTIYLGEDATATGQETKIEYDRSSDTLGIFAKGQGTYREHVRFGNPSSTTARTYFSGDVGIRDTTPSYELDVNGTIRATGDVIAYSDIRVKENIKTIDNALDKVKSLRGVEYNKIDNPEKSIGVIAQEIEEVIPEVVKEDDQGMKSVAYGNITAVLIEAIKEQQKQIDELKNQLNAFTK